MERNLSFKIPSNFKRGLLYGLLVASYRDLLNDPNLPRIHHLLKDWRRFDYEVFGNEKVRKCVLVSCLDESPIGFVSYDPRQKPVGTIGHNCILPAFRRKGYGKQQLKKLITTMSSLDEFEILRVTTGDYPFFIPAQKTYESLGFRLTEKKNR